MQAGTACAVCVTTQEPSLPMAGTVPVLLAAAKGSLDANYPVVLCGLLQASSHLFQLWLLSVSKKDAEMGIHPPSTSMVTSGTTVTVSPGSGGLRTPKPSPGSVAHRALPHGPSQTLR